MSSTGNRKWLLRGPAIALAIVVAIAVLVVLGRDDGGGGAVASAESPNIVWVMTDDQEAASMRVMPKTRRLIGDHGVTFENSFLAWPLCCPARATLQTGQHAHNHGVLENRPPLGGFTRLDVDETVPVWLQDAGYRTVQVGKYMNDYKPEHGVPPGWTEWYALTEPSNRYFEPRMNEQGEIHVYGTDPKDYSTDLFTRRAVQFIRRQHRDDPPFFLSIGYVAPHVGKTYVTDGKCGTVARNGPEPAPRHDGAFAHARLPRGPSFNEDDVSDKPKPIRRLPKLRGKLLRQKEARYGCRLASLLAVDEGVARIIRALRASGQLDNTYVFYTSDNGYLQGQHRIDGGKSIFYEEALRVPLLVRGPGVPRGRKVQELVSDVDWAATILDIAGVEPQGHPLDGQSMLSAIDHPRRVRGRALLIESARERYSGVRTDRYVYVRYQGGNGYEEGEVEMYDLWRDPAELENVADDPDYAGAREALGRLTDRLRSCEGAECEALPRIELGAERRPAGDRAAGCESGRTEVTASGDDAAAVRKARVRSGDVRAAGELPLELELAPRRPARIRAELELVDGRVVDLETRLPGCGRT